MSTLVGAPTGVVASHVKYVPPPIPTVGLQGWWDAADTATIIHTAGSVSQWNDKSGKGLNLTQATTANQPTTGTHTLNGRNVIDHDTTTNFKMLTSVLVTLPQPFTYVFVGKADAIDAATTRSAMFAGSVHLRTDGAGYWSILAGTALRGPAQDTAPHVFVGEFNGATSSIVVDGVPTVGDAGTTGIVGNALTIGRNSTATGWNGQVAEVNVYNRVLSTVERQQVEAYLTAKWIPQPPPFPATGLQGWWDAADASSFSYSTAPAVSQWKDKSGNNRHFAQATPANQPARNGTISGRTSVVFDGTRRMTTGSWAMTLPYTMFAVARNTSTGAQGIVVILSPDGRIYRPASDLIAMWAGGGPLTTGQLWGTTAAHSVTAVFAGGAISQLTIDGGSTVTGNAGSAVPAGLGTSALGSSVGASEFWSGDIAEVIIYDRALSAAERSDVEAYLSTKWGTPWTPASLAGLFAWYDASDATTITADGSNKVTQWKDKSANAYHITGNSTSYPTTGATQINGLNVIDFIPDATSKSLWRSGVTLPQPFTVTVFAKSNTTYAGDPASTRNMFAWGNSNGFVARRVGYHAMSGGTVLDSAPLLTDTAAHVWSATFNGASSGIRVDRTTVATGNAGTGGIANTLMFVSNGTSGSPGESWNGPIGEVVVVNRALSANELTRLESYLKTKWGTP